MDLSALTDEQMMDMSVRLRYEKSKRAETMSCQDGFWFLMRLAAIQTRLLEEQINRMKKENPEWKK